ncbi:MAG: T9SS type A sorting domain-containing protein [Bacteroidales bacterium]|nr:T9SS type A sorting domain-containing protein [Bacteroidales bacterium]
MKQIYPSSKKNYTKCFWRYFFSLTLFLLFQANGFEVQAQKSVDSLNFATDGKVNATVISGNYLYLGGNFNNVGRKTGPVVFFNNGATTPDESKPIVGDIRPYWMSDKVFAVAPDGAGGWYIGGSFTEINNKEHLRLAHILPDNTLDHSFDMAFNSGEIDVLKTDETFLYVGGKFSINDNSGASHVNVLRINLVTKTIDPNWNPALASSGQVKKMEISSDKVILGGSIGKIDNIQQGALVVLNKSDGTRISLPTVNSVTAMHLMGDTLIIAESNLYWSSNNNGSGYLSPGLVVLDETNDIPAFTAPLGEFRSSISDGNDGWYVIGNYIDFDGTGVYHLDKDLNPIAAFSPPNINSFDANNALLLVGNNLYVSYSQYVTLDDGQGNAIKYLCKLDATTGALDTAFKPNPNGNIYSIIENNGVLYLGGIFDSIGTEARTSLGAIDANTGSVQSWNPEIHFDNYNAGYTGPDRYISDLMLVNNKLYVAGMYQMSTATLNNGGRGIYGLSRFDITTGDLDTTFHISTFYSDQTKITGIAVKEDQLFVVGNFNLKPGDVAIKNVGVVDANTAALTNINTDLEFTVNSSSSSPRILIKNDILYVMSMGVKKVSTGESRPYFFSLNATDGTLTNWNPNPDDYVFSMSFSNGKLLLSGYFEFLKSVPGTLLGIKLNTGEYVEFPSVYTINSIVSSDKYIFMGGDFTKFSDSIANGLVRLNRRDLSYTKFDHQIQNNNSRAALGSLALGTEGLYAVGAYSNMFNLVAGVPRQNICLLDTETAGLKTWNPPSFDGKVYRVFSFDSHVVMSGDFGLMPSWTRAAVAKIDLASKTVTNWNPAITGYYPAVYSLLVSGDTVYIGGKGIGKINGTDAGNLSAVNALSGSQITGFTPVQIADGYGDDLINFIAKRGNSLYASGEFKKVNEKSHNCIVKLNATTGAVSDWDPKLVAGWNPVYTLLPLDTAVYIGGYQLKTESNEATGFLLRTDTETGTLKKIYPAAFSAKINSIAMNENGVIAAATDYSKGLFILDKNRDTLMVVENQPEFKSGLSQIRTQGNFFMAAGNREKEFGSYTDKPGFILYDTQQDSVTMSFSIPLMQGSISTYAFDGKNLAVGGEFDGMNTQIDNSNIAILHVPEIMVEPGVSSWSPQTANTIDPFALSIYGNGFGEQSAVSLKLSGEIVLPDSLQVTSNKIIAFFNGTNFTEGKWDMEVTLDSQSSPLSFPAAVNIVTGATVDVWAKWTGPNRVLANRPTTCYVTYGNSGNKDAYGVILYVAVGPNQTVLFPKEIKPQQVSIEVNWDTIPNYVDVDYFLGTPFHGKVYTLFIPYMPQQYNGGMKLKVTSEGGTHEIRVAISQPIYDTYNELFESMKSSQGLGYGFFSCMYAVAGLVADLTPGLSCAKAAFDNSVLMAVDKYQKGESIKVEDIANSVAMTAIGCVPGEAQLSTAFKIAKGMAAMYSGASDAGGAVGACSGFAGDCFKTLEDMVAFQSHDPNAKYGPAGRGSSFYVPTDREYQYMITYENDSTATAAAQRVIITDTLDKNVLDINSFRPVGFGFSDTSYFYQPTDGDTVDIDMRPKKAIIVRVFHQLDISSGILTWTFLTLDPNTYELVEGVDDGFLPPNKKSPEGEGNVLYTIQPLSGLTEGTEIKNSAHIVFDWNEAIPTDVWKNITDNLGPESAVNPLPGTSMIKDFTVKWKGTDKGSGIFSYTIYVSENDSTYYPWILDTYDSTAVFSGEGGVTYKFYSVATDSAGNKEATPTTYDAMTYVSGTGIETFGSGNKLQFMVYPNPAKEVVNIDYYLPASGSVSIDIFNLCGYMVMKPYKTQSRSGKNTVRFDLSKYSPGYYFVRIVTPSGTQTRKVVIQ